MRDRQHLRALGEPLQRGRDGVRRDAADAGVDLVEDERLAARDRRQRKGDPRELAAGCRLGHRPERETRVRTDEEDGLVRAGRAGLALAKFDEELALPHPEPLQLARDRVRERTRVCAPDGAELLGERADACFRSRDRLCGRRDRVVARRSVVELALRGGRAIEELLERRRAEAALEIGDAREPLLDLLERSRVGFERREEGVQVAAHLAEPDRDVPELGRRRAQLGRDPLERRERALGAGSQRGGAFALLGRDRVGRLRGRLLELGDMAEPLPLRAQRLVVAGLESFGVLDERLELREPRCGRVGVPRQLLVAAAGGAELAPRQRSLAAALELLGAAERVEDVELEGRAGEPTLLELARHRDQPFRSRRDVLARDRTTPGVRARAPVAEDAAGEHETGLALRPQLGERRHVVLVEEPVGNIELGFDVRLGALAPDRGRIRTRPEQQPHRLREDRLPGPGLPGDRVQPGPEGQVGLPDEDEVLDPEPTKQSPYEAKLCR